MIQKVTFYFTPNTVRYQLAKNHSVNTVEKKREGKHLLLNEEHEKLCDEFDKKIVIDCKEYPESLLRKVPL